MDETEAADVIAWLMGARGDFFGDTGHVSNDTGHVSKWYLRTTLHVSTEGWEAASDADRFRLVELLYSCRDRTDGCNAGLRRLLCCCSTAASLLVLLLLLLLRCVFFHVAVRN